jgi:PucR C-terminal helix-turn-helix domain
MAVKQDAQLRRVGLELDRRADRLADRVLVEVRRAAPGDAPLDPVTLRNLRIGARHALGSFAALLQSGSAADPSLALFEAHGRAQRAAGRSMEEMLAFYRLGGLAIWRASMKLPLARSIDAQSLLRLGVEMFVFIDELSAAAVKGFTAQDAEARWQMRARRERLLALLLAEERPSCEAVAAAARGAEWPLPERVRVAVAPEGGGSGSGVPPQRVLTGSLPDGSSVLIVGDDPEFGAWLLRAERALGTGRPMAVGPALAPEHAARSAESARKLLALCRAGVVESSDVVCCDDHELELLLSADPELAADFASRLLAPFDDLRPLQREKLLATLAAWLEIPDRPQAIAEHLGVHVQTVRYRLAQLRDMLGDLLDDPRMRFRLSVALHARAIGAPADGALPRALPQVARAIDDGDVAPNRPWPVAAKRGIVDSV